MDEFFWLQIGQKRKRFQFDCSIIRCNDLVNRKSRAGPSLLSLPRRGAIASSTSFGRVWQGWGNALVCWLPSLSANTSTPSYIYIPIWKVDKIIKISTSSNSSVLLQAASAYAPVIAGLLGCGVKNLEETAAARQRPPQLLTHLGSTFWGQLQLKRGKMTTIPQ